MQQPSLGEPQLVAFALTHCFSRRCWSFPAMAMRPSSGTACWCKLPARNLSAPCCRCGSCAAVHCVDPAACVFAAEYVHLPTYRERNSFRDAGSGEGSAAHALGADGLRRAVHSVPQVPDHHAHRTVSTAGQLSCLGSCAGRRSCCPCCQGKQKAQSGVNSSFCSLPFQVFPNQLLHKV